MRLALLATAALILLSGMVWADPTNSRPIIPADDDLQDFFDTYVTGETYDAVDDQSVAAQFRATGTGSVTSYVFSAIGAFTYQDGDVFGIYSVYTGTEVPIFTLHSLGTLPTATVYFVDADADTHTDDVIVSGLTGVVNGTYLNFGPDVFGYYTSVGYDDPSTDDYSPGDTWETHYTEDSENPGDSAWALTFQGHGGQLAMPGGLSPVSFDSNHWMTAFEVFHNPNTGSDFDDVIIVAESVAPIPEPTTLILIGAGLVGFGLLRRRKRS
jgi:hypothetical protein